MTAALLVRSHGMRSGLRPVDPRRDMRGIARVIELAFEGRLDSKGQWVVRWMRRLGRLGWLGWVLSWYVLPPAARPLGFVWEIDGQIVGNASLLEVRGHPQRWVIANVGVHPQSRGKGIGRALVSACIDLAHKLEGRHVILQVDRENQQAVDLYVSLGFRSLSKRVTWVGVLDRTRYEQVAPGEARRRQREEWKEQWHLARQAHPEGLVWPYPLSASLFRPHSLIGGMTIGSGMHWVWKEAGHLIGSVTAHPSSEHVGWHLMMIVAQAGRDRIEAPLLACCLSQLPAHYGQIVLEYLDGVAESGIRALGFAPKRHLTWMGLDLQSRRRSVA